MGFASLFRSILGARASREHAPGRRVDSKASDDLGDDLEVDLDVDLDALEAEASTTREDHYTFAHVALRHVVARDSVHFLLLMADDKAVDLLSDLWEQVRSSIGGEDLVPPEDVRFEVHLRKVPPYRAAIIVLPPAVGPSEAHMVAVVPLIDFSRLEGPLDSERRKSTPHRFFILERTGAGSSWPTAFCEWSERGGHLNYGAGPEPDVGLFTQRVAEMIATAGENEG